MSVKYMKMNRPRIKPRKLDKVKNCKVKESGQVLCEKIQRLIDRILSFTIILIPHILVNFDF